MLFSTRHRWVKQISHDPLLDFGKSGAKKISKLLSEQDNLAISYQFSTLDENFFTWFTPQYNEQIGSKKAAPGPDIISKTLHRENAKFPYLTLTVFESMMPVGGVIFTLRKNRLSIAYRVFKPDWANQAIRCSPSLFSEYLLAREALDHNLTKMVHGVDNNPYGLNSAIGLAIFKLSAGFYPELSIKHEIKELNPLDYSTDILVLEPEVGAKRIKSATLVTTTADLHKYEQLFKYEQLLKVKTVFKDAN